MRDVIFNSIPDRFFPRPASGRRESRPATAYMETALKRCRMQAEVLCSPSDPVISWFKLTMQTTKISLSDCINYTETVKTDI